MRMLFPLLLPGLILQSPAFSNELTTFITQFCEAVREANQRNIPANPVSPLGTALATDHSRSDFTYPQMWAFAKSLGIPACDAMW